MAKLINNLLNKVTSPKKQQEQEQPHLSINSHHHSRRISLRRLFTNNNNNNNNNSSLYSQSSSIDHKLTHSSIQQPNQQEVLEYTQNKPIPRRSLSLSAPIIEKNNKNNQPEPEPETETNHLTPFHSITSKLRQSRQPSPKPTLRNSHSLVSLAETIKSCHPQSKSTTTSNPPQSSFSLKSFRNVRATLLDPPISIYPNLQQQQQPLKPSSQSSLSLPLVHLPPPSNTNTNSNYLSRPASVTTISRPSSPSSKISAAAFREARAARNSRSITSASFPEPPSLPKLQSSSTGQTNSKYIKHTRFKSSPQTHLTNNNNNNNNHSNNNTTPRPSSLVASSVKSADRITRNPITLADLHQSPHRYSTFNSFSPSTNLNPNPHSSSTGLYNDNEVLIPPRPPFYGSRLPARSASADPRTSLYYPPQSSNHDASTSLNNRRPSTVIDTRSLYSHPFINQSSASIRSVPSTLVQPTTPLTPYTRRRSATTTKSLLGSDQPQLDQWHSDEEDDQPKSSTLLHPKPISPFPSNPTKPQHHPRISVNNSDVKEISKPVDDDDDDEDEVPLSKLKKKSLSSLRGTAAAQTLARERQQLHVTSTSVKPVPPGFLQSPSPLGGGSHNTPANHNRHVSASFLPTHHRDSSLNVHRQSKFISGHTSPTPKAEGHAPIRTILHPRGNSPASSSSGSGSGSWSIPITPRNSTGNLNLLLPPPPSSAGYQHAHVVPNFQQDVLKSRFNLPSPKSPTFDQSQSDIESIISCGNPSKTSSSSINPEPQQKSLAHQDQPAWNHHGVTVEDLNVPPAGVDHFLYSTLGIEQKIELHHRSEMMKQMMAAQAKAAVQMHAMALSNAAGARRKTVLDEGSGPILEYDPSRMMYNWSPTSVSVDPTAINSPPATNHEERRPSRLVNRQQSSS